MQAFPSGPGAAALARAAASARAAADVRIEWDQGTRRFACAGVYGRARKLSDGALALVYSRGGDVCLRRSIDGGESWQAEMVVAHTSGYSNTNAELIELADGRLVYGWNGRPTAGGPYRIATRTSEDMGRSWGDERIAYSGGRDFGTGCWEPAFLEPVPGDLQLYFANETPYSGSNASGETMLSVQSMEGREASAAPTDHAVMKVYLGDASARNFTAPTTPFPGIPATGNGLWNP